MKFYTHNDKDIQRDGGCYQGLIACSYRLLVKLFGEPMKDGFDNYKCDAEWTVEFEDGAVMCIYNWKNGANYCGKMGIPTQEIDEWHIGGQSREVVSRVSQILAGSTSASHMASST